MSWKITRLYLCSSNNIFFGHKDPIKAKFFFRLLKCSDQNLSNFLCQFWNGKSIPLQVLYSSSVSWKIIPLCFFSSSSIYFAQKEPIKMKIYETFHILGSKFVKLLMPIFKRRVNSSPNFASLFSFMKDYSSVLF